MVLLGGLEFVAAGYVLNELNKDSKKDAKKDPKRRTEGKEHRRRKEHRKHSSHHHDSSDSSPSPHRQRPSRPLQQQSLQLPQNGPPRPYSAPPPGSRPMWQPPPFQGQPQQWQPNPVAYRPPQQAPVPYPPPQMQQMPNHPPPQVPRPAINIQQPNINPMYPPAGTYIDMKTGKIQHNLYPPGHEAARSRDFSDEGGRHDIGFSNVVMNVVEQQQQQHHVPSPRPGFAELDSETPGRYYSYDRKREEEPPRYQEYR